ncbi:hypothetical protein ZYGR_0AD07010 [Zygosaccharomyces rouxii]|uniref:tRNA wybutosine-synthesizing protein 3 n=2 Tax=Zygosaccharomyces rouxii TaxID=4956 RepID=C5E1M7_ZYGRC|nr:uncharacterized protein ZYRO0G22286g [Zygosaccharomyces rouxii]KAH9203003.1 tRNA wybutosine-synthesizing protein [Zygosaccharomyces rouxii]GAV51518.1 hypothetical protein ZYGR_0AD07010 [Zygosaccharomyces rouxii]CAR30011.1 ZYRO0G22286p [Zygosaccharomyces rouxii]
MVRQNPFDQKKASILTGIDSEKPDLSPKGDIDVLCIPIIDLINSHQDMVTTSSCSGRVSVFVEGTKFHKGKIKTGGKGEGGRWLFVTHNYQDVPNWMDKIDLNNTKVMEAATGSLNEDTRLVLYKFEPFILHVKCRDFNTASKLYNTAMACGFRESGIGSNNLVALRINIKLDTPIGYYDQETDAIKLYVSKQYVKILDDLSLSKFQDNTRKMEALHDRIKNELF